MATIFYEKKRKKLRSQSLKLHFWKLFFLIVSQLNLKSFVYFIYLIFFSPLREKYLKNKNTYFRVLFLYQAVKLRK